MQLWMHIYLLRSVKSHKRVAKNEKIEVQFWMVQFMKEESLVI